MRFEKIGEKNIQPLRPIFQRRLIGQMRLEFSFDSIDKMIVTFTDPPSLFLKHSSSSSSGEKRDELERCENRLCSNLRAFD